MQMKCFQISPPALKVAGSTSRAHTCPHVQLAVRKQPAHLPSRLVPLPLVPSLNGKSHTQNDRRVACQNVADSDFSNTSGSVSRLGEAAAKALMRATKAMNRYGWLSFWVQLSLSVVSAVILLFSVAFTSQSGPKASLYFTLVGVLASLLSTFWNFGYTRTALKMQAYLEAPPGIEIKKIKKQQVMDMVTKGLIINMVGLGSTLIGVQTLVGMLVAKTLTNSSTSPFMAGTAGYNPVLALDVFLVQAATNTLLGHFLSLCCALWLLHVIGEGKGLKFSAAA